MDHFHIGFFEFLLFGAYLVLWKAVFLWLNLEARRNNWHVPAAVSGLIS
ncbi:MAG TPA: hypothetical protein VGV89_07155 [Thermoplasmata archaeon]|nr:hypothetical protein [Thermoplasmata archaeon]